LTGPRDFIREARRVRKRFGGGMRQAGIIAAAGLYALDHHVLRLTEDHARAKKLEEGLLQLPYVGSVLAVESNIVVFTLRDVQGVPSFLAKLRDAGIGAMQFGPGMVRMVLHLDVDDHALAQVIATLQRLAA
jgi:threonine aldolase